jgi:hypothetical protein
MTPSALSESLIEKSSDTDSSEKMAGIEVKYSLLYGTIGLQVSMAA